MIILQNKDYELKPIQFEDMEMIRIARNEQIDVLRQTHEISKEEQSSYFHDVITPNLTNPNPEMVLFSLYKKNLWIGYGGLVHIDWKNKHAEVSFLVDSKRAVDKKIYEEDFTNFLNLLSNTAFKKLNLHHLFTETYNFRDEHISILEKFGFKQEGVLRDHLLIKNNFHDSIIHGLLAGEFLNDL